MVFIWERFLEKNPQNLGKKIVFFHEPMSTLSWVTERQLSHDLQYPLIGLNHKVTVCYSLSRKNILSTKTGHYWNIK